MYEHSKQSLVPRSVFLGRLARNAAAAFCLTLISLAVGMAGYHFIEDMPWIDAYEEAAMILSGMGPVASIKTSAGKLFAGTYALYSGLTLILIVGVIVAPVAHRFLHRFHLAEDEGKASKRKG